VLSQTGNLVFDYNFKKPCRDRAHLTQSDPMPEEGSTFSAFKEDSTIEVLVFSTLFSLYQIPIEILFSPHMLKEPDFAYTSVGVIYYLIK
jgi:hypothetical protein